MQYHHGVIRCDAIAAMSYGVTSSYLVTHEIMSKTCNPMSLLAVAMCEMSVIGSKDCITSSNHCVLADLGQSSSVNTELNRMKDNSPIEVCVSKYAHF